MGSWGGIFHLFLESVLSILYLTFILSISLVKILERVLLLRKYSHYYQFGPKHNSTKVVYVFMDTVLKLAHCVLVLAVLI